MNERELIDKGLTAYRQALEAGMDRTEAKEFAYSEVPAIRPVLKDRGFLTHWGNGIKAVDKALGIGNGSAPHQSKVKPLPTIPANGKNGRGESFIRTSSGRINVTDSLLAWLENRRPAIGTVINLGDIDLWADLIGVTATGVTMPFRYYDGRKQVGLARAGWQFEIVNPSYRCFSVRVVAAPAPPTPPEPIAPPPPAE